MRKVLLSFAIVVTIAMASSAMAQTPYFQVYFDQGMQEAAADCPAGPLGSVMDTLYVVGHNFNAWIKAAEYSIDYGSYLIWVADTPLGGALRIGESPTGVSLAWPTRRNGWNPIMMMQVTVFWNCNDCTGIGGTPESKIVIMEYPGKPSPRAVNWETNEIINGVGMTSLICAQVPVEDSTWGQIKALYN